GDCSTSVGNTIHCTLPASLGVGATWTISVPYDVAPTVSPQTVTNTATAQSDEDPAVVSASDSTDVVESATPPPGGALPPSSTGLPPSESPSLDLTLAALVVLVFLASALLLGRPRTR
ncbi:MAG: hypothetical protein ACXWW6_04685, partial [Candidatus Limnocylindrales bacterium]